MHGQRGKQRDIFAPIIGKLRQDTAVPLKLPPFLPFNNDRANPLYVNGSADEQGYRIEIGLTPDCEGQHVCHYGTLFGSRRRIEMDDGKRVAVVLAGGVRGEFHESTCAAYCSDVQIGWPQDGYFYMISLKAATPAELKRMVNSAIGTAVHKEASGKATACRH